MSSHEADNSPHADLSKLGLKCRNFKCFAHDLQGFDKLMPINIVIGRNNSGKSTLLDLIEYAVSAKDISGRGHKSSSAECIMISPLDQTILERFLPQDRVRVVVGNQQWEFTPRDWCREHLLGMQTHWQVLPERSLILDGVPAFQTEDQAHLKHFEEVALRLTNKLANPFSQFLFLRIVADRDIVPEAVNGRTTFQSNGVGLTEVLRRFIVREPMDRDLVEVDLLNDLNQIIGPDALFDRLLIQEREGEGKENGQKVWELFLQEGGKGRIRLSDMGSGVKTVLMVLANILLAPRLQSPPVPLNKVIFGFEELENNLHPSVQRRLFQYLRNRAVQDGCHFVVTTHSSVVIDMFANDHLARIIHVTHDGESSRVTTVQTTSQGRCILDDLDVRASDLLQTNVVVWVEGPSDRIYFRRWVDIWSEGRLVEGVHYSCVPYGGSLSHHLSFAPEEEVVELIAAVRICRHAIFLADSDKRSAVDELKKNTERLESEAAADGYGWVTAGKEVENYIPGEILTAITASPQEDLPGQFGDILDFIRCKKENKTAPPKVGIAQKVAEKLTRELIEETLDLAEHLDTVVRLICAWNGVELSDEPVTMKGSVE